MTEFKPVNRLEELLVRAASDPVARPEFYRELLRATLYLLTPEGAPSGPSNVPEGAPSGPSNVPEGTALNIVNWQGPSGPITPIFSARERVEHVVQETGQTNGFVAIEGSAVFGMLAQKPQDAILNPGFPFGKQFTTEEIGRLADGTVLEPERREAKEQLKQGHQLLQREAGPSPRLGLSKEDVDPAEVLAERVDAVAGLFPREDQAVLEDLKKNGPPPGKTVGKVFDELRLNAMRRSGIDVEGLTDKDLRGSGTIHLFPNFLGPITHGNATLYRARPNGLDPDSTLLDYWALEWVPLDAEPKPVERKFYDDWTTKDWGLINNQDFANLAEVTKGMKSKGYRGAMLNPVQEANLIHHHRMLDRYLSA